MEKSDSAESRHSRQLIRSSIERFNREPRLIGGRKPLTVSRTIAEAIDLPAAAHPLMENEIVGRIIIRRIWIILARNRKPISAGILFLATSRIVQDYPMPD